MHSTLALLGQGICDRDNRDASTHSTRDDTGEPGFEPVWLSPLPITLLQRPGAAVKQRGRGIGEGVSRRVTRYSRWCPDRRESHPHLGVDAPHRPALVGQWDVMRRRRALSFAVELRCPVARGQCPCAPKIGVEEPARFELAAS